MRGKIEKVWENKSRQGQKYLTAVIGGERYNVWDEKLFDGVKEGALVDYDTRKAGKYLNITAMQSASVNGSAPNVGNAGAGTVPYAGESRNRNGEEGLAEPEFRSKAIRRMSCLKSATALVASLELGPDLEPAEYTLEVARRFERYVAEGEQVRSGTADGQNKAGSG